MKKHPANIFLKKNSTLFHYLFFLIWILPWIATRLASLVLKPNEKSLKYSYNSLVNAQNGDIVLLRSRIPSPWGYWRHCGIIFDLENRKMIHSAFLAGVEFMNIDTFIRNREIAILRPSKITPAETQKALLLAQEHLGKPFTFFSNKNKDKDKIKTPSAFSCSGFVFHTLHKAINLDVPSGTYTFPDTFIINLEYFDVVK